jgi:hypothetical protein
MSNVTAYVATSLFAIALLASCTLTQSMDDYAAGPAPAEDGGPRAADGSPPDAHPDETVKCASKDEKSCSSVCRSIFDPRFGCGPSTCAPCTLANAAVDGCDATGHCRLGACLTGFENCNGKAEDGCEANLASDPDHCGTCATKCGNGKPNATASCTEGKCTVTSCAPGFANCNTKTDDGCEVSTLTDVAHCGTCDHACPAMSSTTFACTNGSCTIESCSLGYIDCDKVDTTGCECGFPNAQVHCVTPAAPGGPDASTSSTCGFTACSGTFADCNKDLAKDGCEIDTASDAGNCGACGFSCEGAACAGGRCQPKQIIGNQGNPGQLVLDLDYAYWSNYGAGGIYGSIYRVRKDSVNPTLIAGGSDTSENSAWGIATSDGTSSVFWTTYGASSHVATALKVGGQRSVVASTTGRLRGAALDGSYLYWANYEQNAILRVNMTVSGAPVEPVAQGASVSRPNTIAFDGASVYWSNEGIAQSTTAGTPTSQASTGSIVAVTKASIGAASPAITTLATGQDKPRGLVVDDTNVYWTNVGTAASSGAIARVAKDGSAAQAVTIIASALGTPRELALCTGGGCSGDSYLYASIYGTGSIVRVAKNAPAGTAPATIATGQKGPIGIAVDAKYIFWANYGTSGTPDGTIMKLLKQP